MSILFGLIYWQYRKSNGTFWFRILGHGLAFYKVPMFSDRYFKRKKYFGYYIMVI